jgi:hypothetical protein
METVKQEVGSDASVEFISTTTSIQTPVHSQGRNNASQGGNNASQGGNKASQ